MSEVERRLATERLIWRFRLCAWVFALVQTTVRTGDDPRISWGFVIAFGLSIGAARLALRGEPSDAVVRRTGTCSMAVDVAVVASALVNNLTDPAEPIALIAVLGMLEASMRWWFWGGALAGLAGGSAAAAWTWAVYDAVDQPFMASHATLRFGVLLVVGTFIGAIVQRANLERRSLQHTLDVSRDLIVTLAPTGTILSVNAACVDLLGYQPHELVGRSYREFVEEVERSPEGGAAFDQIADGNGTVVADRRFIRSDGTHCWLELNLTRVDGGDLVYVVGRDVTERRAASARLQTSEQRFRHQARHDSLTGLPNRLVLDELLQAAVDDRRGTGLALLFVNLDRFKVVNDSLGHHRGDDLLVAVVDRLQGCLRTEDVLVRWAGDEFCAVLAGAGRAATAVAVAERMLEALQEPVELAGRQVRISASIGVAVATGPREVPDLLLRADQAMYDAKRAGRSRVSVHASAPCANAQSPLDLEVALRQAIEVGGLSLAYQPVVELATGCVVGFESLVRWVRDDGTTLPPAAFIPLAEECGLIRSLTRWGLVEACRQLAAWDVLGDGSGGGPPLSIGVNVSALDLADPALLGEVTGALAGSGIAPERLVLEVPETMLVADAAALGPIVDGIRALGVQLAIDDFGVGCSSLSQLQHLPVSMIKVDRAFLLGVVPGSRSAAVLTSFAGLSEAFDLPFVAEGIEHPEQLEVLVAAGYRYGQGDLFAPPGSPGEVLSMVVSRTVELPVPAGAGAGSRSAHLGVG